MKTFNYVIFDNKLKNSFLVNLCNVCTLLVISSFLYINSIQIQVYEPLIFRNTQNKKFQKGKYIKI